MPTDRELAKVYFTGEEMARVREAAGEESVSGFIRRTVLNNLGPVVDTGIAKDAPKIKKQLEEFSKPVTSDGAGTDQDVPRGRVVSMDQRGVDSSRNHSRSAAVESPPSQLPLSGVATDEHPKDCRCRVCDFAREAGLKPKLPPLPKKEPKREKEKGRKR